MNTCTETFAPFINCVIDDALFQAMLDIDQTLLQFIDVINSRLVVTLLHFSRILQSAADGCGADRSGEMNVAVSRYRRLIVSRVECVLAGRQTRICHRDFLRVGKYPLNLKHIPVLCPTDLHRKINDPRSVRPVLNTLIHTSSATWDNYTTDEWHEHLRACIFVSISKLDILIF